MGKSKENRQKRTKKRKRAVHEDPKVVEQIESAVVINVVKNAGAEQDCTTTIASNNRLQILEDMDVDETPAVTATASSQKEKEEEIIQNQDYQPRMVHNVQTLSDADAVDEERGSMATTTTARSTSQILIPHLIRFVDGIDSNTNKDISNNNNNVMVVHKQAKIQNTADPFAMRMEKASEDDAATNLSAKPSLFDQSVRYLANFLETQLELRRQQQHTTRTVITTTTEDRNQQTREAMMKVGTQNVNPGATGDDERSGERKESLQQWNSFVTLEIAQLFLRWIVQRLTSAMRPTNNNSNNLQTRSTQPPSHESNKTGHSFPDEEDLIDYKILDLALQTLLQSPHPNNEKYNKNDDMVAQSIISTNSRVSSVLTQSNLGKIIPPMLLCALKQNQPPLVENQGTQEEIMGAGIAIHNHHHIGGSSTVGDATAAACATNVFRTILLHHQLYRPTLDVALHSILLPLVAAAVLISPQDLLMPIRTTQLLLLSTTTLEWIHSSLLARGNPKTSFHLLVQPHILAALSKLYHHKCLFGDDNDYNDESEDNDGDDENNNQDSAACCNEQAVPQSNGADREDSVKTSCLKTMKQEGRKLIRTIVSDGLVSSHHHLEGLLPLLRFKRKKQQQQHAQGQADTTSNDADQSTTTTTKSSFRCYQEELIVCLESCFRTSSRNNSTNETSDSTTKSHQEPCSTVDQRACIQLLPVLFEEFLLQLDILRNKAGKKKKSSGDTVITSSSTAFELFIVMISPLLLEQQHDREKDVVTLHALRELTRVLLVHNVYVASQDDAKQSQTRFLESIITTKLLAFPQQSTITQQEEIDQQHLAQVIGTLENMMELNHALLHDRLVPTLLMVCSLIVSEVANSNTNPAQAAMQQFWICALNNYRKLRQQSHLIKCILDVIASLVMSSSLSGVMVVEWLLQQPAVSLSLARTVQASPLSEIQSSFDILEEWFLLHYELKDNGGSTARRTMQDDDEDATVNDGSSPPSLVTVDPSSYGLSIAVDFAVLLFQAIPVEQATASSVSEWVNHFTQTIIPPLSNKSNGTNASLKLCSWLIRLQDQCSFWLGQGSQLEIPPSVQIQVENADFHSRASAGQGIDASVLLLASHRLQQIVSLIHHEQLAQIHNNDEQAMHDDHTSKSSKEATLESEGQCLAALLARAAVDKLSSSKQWCGWIYIAQCVHVWSVFAKEDAIEQFLVWVVVSLSQEIPTLVGTAVQHRERQVALALVNDIAFLDNQRIGPKLGIVALRRSIEWVAEAMGLERHKWAETLEILSSPTTKIEKHCVLDTRFFEEVTAFSLDIKQTQIQTDEEGNKSILRANEALRFISSLPSSLLSAGDVITLFRTSAWLEWVVVANMEELCELTRSSMFGLIGALRTLLEKTFAILSNEPADEEQMLTTDEGQLERQFNYVSHHISSTKDLLKFTGGEEEQWIKNLLFSSEVLLAKLSRHLIQTVVSNFEQGGRGKHLARVVSLVSMEQRELSLVGRSASTKAAFLSGLLTIKSLLRGAEETRSSFMGNDDVHHSVFFLDLWRQCWEAFGVCTARFSYGTMHKELAHMVLGELVRLMTSWNVQEDKAIARMHRTVENDLKELTTADHQRNRTAHYNLACLVRARPSYSQVELVLDGLSTNVHIDDSNDDDTTELLNATFCELVKRLDSMECDNAVARLLSDDPSPEAAKTMTIRLRLCTLLLDAKMSGAQGMTEVLSKRSHEVFALALRSLYPLRRRVRRNGDNEEEPQVTIWEQQIVKSTRLLCALIRRKDIMVLREKDLAIILSYLSSVITSTCLLIEDGNGPTPRPFPTCVFVGCAKTVLLLLQRCSKQLYACVPLVISVLSAFLKTCLAMTTTTTTTFAELNLETCGNELCRLCETLIAHREVYKKHVIGLVLEFVDAVPTIRPAIKNAVLPSVHCLLDMMTIHERKQLNTLMGTSSKSTFRAIYHNYQKLHSYKGQ